MAAKETFWSRRNNLEKILIGLIVLLLCFVLALFIVVLLQYGRLFKSKTTICISPQCIKASTQIIDYIDTSIDPCDNFYGFVCGTFLKRAAVNGQISATSDLEALVQSQLNAVISEPVGDDAPAPLQAMHRFYRSCRNLTAIEEDAGDTLLNLIENWGSWPLLKGRFWNGNHYDWRSSIVKSRELGFIYQYFFQVVEMPDFTNTGLFLLSLKPPQPNYFLKEFKEFYIDMMTDIAVELGVPSDQAKTDFIRVVQFEEQIHKFIEDETLNGSNDTIMTIAGIETLFPNIEWLQLLRNITRTATLDQNSLVDFKIGRYFRHLETFLNQTPKKIQANFIVWKFIEHFHPYLNKNVRDRYLQFVALTSGQFVKNSLDNTRSEFCLKEAQLYFPSVAEVAYVRKYVDPIARDDLQGMVHAIKEELKSRVKQNDWIDSKTKKLALRRLDKIKQYVGASDMVFGDNFEDIVELAGLPSDNIIEMITSLYIKKQDNSYKIIGQNCTEITTETLEATPIMDINAFLISKYQTLIIAAPFIQGIMYDMHRPHYMNFGTMGSVIGHELTHALAVQGNDSLEEGVGVWWSPETIERFADKSQCLIDEYENYSELLKEFTMNGTEALQENLADFTGPDLAYEAYQKWVEDHGMEQELPGLKYTANQIFWIMFGAFKCIQPNHAHFFAVDKHHGVPSFAVSGSVRNSPHFAADFGCPVNTKMNPANKCRIF